MSRIKDYALEEESRGFYPVDATVCSRCIGNDALRRFIRRTGEVDKGCSYCGDKAAKTSVRFDAFISHMIDCIETEWGDPNNEGVGWEQGWVGAEVIDSYDLLNELDVEFNSSKLQDDVRYSLSDRHWCALDPYALNDHEALTAGWKEFARRIKHESRYVFFRIEDERSELRGSDEIPPAEFLDALGATIRNRGLYSTLRKGRRIQRLRWHSPAETLTTAKKLGSPPAEFAKFPNRMSAAGISAFYGAFDKATVLAETDASSGDKTQATIGIFKTLRSLTLVDFTDIPRVPSIFEPNSRRRRHELLFLWDFLSDFTAPVVKDGREHIEYVPTQAVAEYLRFIHRGADGQPIDGILYPSSRENGSTACVLFFGPNGVCDPEAMDESAVLVLASTETFST